MLHYRLISNILIQQLEIENLLKLMNIMKVFFLYNTMINL